MSGYVGRFAPSPSGALHAGSLVAALASWLDARAHAGTWLVRIEDIDTPRCVPGAADEILRQLAALGLLPDAPVLRQSSRTSAYQAALDQLIAQRDAYGCACSRSDIVAALAARGLPRTRHGELIYPGTCRTGLHGKPVRAWRLRIAHGDASIVHWRDRRLGMQQQDVASAVGDFVLKRADGLWAYQLAVVVDDAAQGVTHVVRGEDLADNTPRQLLLQRALHLPTPHYLHVPLVRGADGEKLSKGNGAMPLDVHEPRAALQAAAAALGLQVDAADAPLHDWLAGATRAWAAAHAMSET